jgi:protein SCO1/2
VVAGKEGYTIDHSAGTYVFDKQGRLRLFMNFGEKPKDIAQDLSLIL